jgi:hypothetical protein
VLAPLLDDYLRAPWLDEQRLDTEARWTNKEEVPKMTLLGKQGGWTSIVRLAALLMACGRL